MDNEFLNCKYEVTFIGNNYFGRDEYFNSVIVTSNENLTGKIRKVKIDKCNQNTLFGEVILEDKPKEYAA